MNNKHLNKKTSIPFSRNDQHLTNTLHRPRHRTPDSTHKIRSSDTSSQTPPSVDKRSQFLGGSSHEIQFCRWVFFHPCLAKRAMETSLSCSMHERGRRPTLAMLRVHSVSTSPAYPLPRWFGSVISWPSMPRRDTPTQETGTSSSGPGGRVQSSAGEEGGRGYEVGRAGGNKGRREGMRREGGRNEGRRMGEIGREIEGGREVE